MPRLEVTRNERRNYPTYRTAHRVVHNDMTAPVEFIGWTLLRATIIAPGMALAGIRGWQLPLGAVAGSSMVSLFALYRSYATKRSEMYRKQQSVSGTGRECRLRDGRRGVRRGRRRKCLPAPVDDPLW
jgi:membrane protein implicated in regulation of membrane protease activity